MNETMGSASESKCDYDHTNFDTVAAKNGVWVSGKKKYKHFSICLFSGDGRMPPYVGFNAPNMPSGCPLGFMLNDEGNPVAQVVKDGKTFTLDLTKLIDVLK